MPDHPLHVVHVLGSLESAGLQRCVLTLVRELPGYRHTIIHNSDARGTLHEEFAERCDVIGLRFQRKSVLAGLGYLPRLARTLRACRADVVIAHLFGNHALVAVAASLAGVRTTYGVSANDPVHYAGSRWQPLVLSQLARPFCSGEIAVSNAVGHVLREALQLPAHRVHVVPNGVRVVETSSRADIGRQSRMPAPRAVLFMAAWINRAKDHAVVIRAAAHLRQRGCQVSIVFAGGANRQAREMELVQLAQTLGIADAVSFLGVRHDVPELIGASDLVVLATHSEGLSTVLLEAFAARTPVIATDIPSCREVLDHGRCGVLVPPRDHVALASAIELLLADRQRREELVANAFRRVREHYSAERMAAGYRELIEAGAKPRRKGPE